MERGNHTHISSRGGLGLILGVAAMLAYATTGIAIAQCGPGQTEAAPEPQHSHEGVSADGTDLVCYPATLSSSEGNWTFYLRGTQAFLVEHARLECAGQRFKAAKIEYPTPSSALIDVTYPQLTPGDQATLVIDGARGLAAKYSIGVVYPKEIPDDTRQPDRLRLQLQPWTLIYPTGAMVTRDMMEGCQLKDLYGKESFLGLLHDLAITKVRKVISNYAEEDSIHWDEKYHREIVTSGDHLRQYLVFVAPGRSELAFEEIFLAFPEVEGAFVNAQRQ